MEINGILTELLPITNWRWGTIMHRPEQRYHSKINMHRIKGTGIYEFRPVRVSPVKEHGFDAYLIQGGIGN